MESSRADADEETAGDAAGRGLAGTRVISFESRRAEEMRSLIERHGGEAFVAPSMREVPLDENADAVGLVRRLESGDVDMLILMTGVGLRAFTRVGEETLSRERFVEVLGAAELVARGPKPIAVLRELGLSPQVRVPEPNTWRELLATLDEHGPLEGRSVAVLEYGERNQELLDGLSERGAEVEAVPVYRWDLPEDTEPLREGVRRLAVRDADYALFTSSAQVDHMIQIAGELEVRDELLEAAGEVTIASVGPICSEALRRHGLPVDLEPEHPKMGHLVVAVARHAEQTI